MGQLSESNANQLLATQASRTSIMLALVCVLFSLVYIVRRLSSHISRPTYSLHPLLPSFISGIYGAVRLGVDEDRFLASLKEKYGSIIYMPFPIGKHFVLETSLINRIYEGSYNKRLSFTPFRLEMGTILFGLSDKVRYDAQQRLEKLVFPILTKGLTSRQLPQPAITRFLDEVEKQLDTLEFAVTSLEGSDSLDIVDWSFDVMFSASKLGLFGPQCPGTHEGIKNSFLAFDHIFPLLTSNRIPSFLQRYLPATRAGVLARARLNRDFGQWAMETGCAGLEQTDVVKATTDEALKQVDKDGTPFYSLEDLGCSLLSHLWALQANAPFAAVWVLIVLMQSKPDLMKDILEEVDSIVLSPEIDAVDTPLLTSIIYETLRLKTSAFSARRSISDTTFPFDQTYVKPNEDVVVISRLSHFDADVWGDNAAVWDPKRFYDAPGSNTHNARRIHEVRSFGGGSSKCEGRMLAVTELRIFLVAILKRFDIQLDESAANVCKDRIGCLMDGNRIHEAVLPQVKPGRPGAGVCQIVGEVPVTVRMRKAP